MADTSTTLAYPYPYDQPLWTVNDQKYWIKMWGYGYRGVKAPYRYIIENNKQDVFEQEYKEYLASKEELNNGA